jgi:hypothetical protein
MTPLKPDAWEKTGEFIYRRGWFGALRLFVEEKCLREVESFSEDFQRRVRIVPAYRWRAARFKDLAFLRETHGTRCVAAKPKEQTP